MENGSTVTLYKWENLQAVRSWDSRHGFALKYCGNYGFVDCDQGQEYTLPDGYEVAEALSGETFIYDEKGNSCEISHVNGVPVLYSVTRRIELKKSQPRTEDLLEER